MVHTHVITAPLIFYFFMRMVFCWILDVSLVARVKMALRGSSRCSETCYTTHKIKNVGQNSFVNWKRCYISIGMIVERYRSVLVKLVIISLIHQKSMHQGFLDGTVIFRRKWILKRSMVMSGVVNITPFRKYKTGYIDTFNGCKSIKIIKVFTRFTKTQKIT